MGITRWGGVALPVIDEAHNQYSPFSAKHGGDRGRELLPPAHTVFAKQTALPLKGSLTVPFFSRCIRVKKQSLTKNYLFQFTYQILITFVPLIISPYLTRTIGSNGLGVYAYSYSIAYYFVMFAMLGIVKYGQRLISESCQDETKLRKSFWSLHCLHAVFSLIAIAAYLAFVALFVHEDVNIYNIQAIYVASALFDITWFFYGLENFQSVVIKNTVIKILECVLIFLLIKKPSDLWIYTLIVSSGLALGQIVMLPQAMKIARPIPVGWGDIKSHIKPLLLLSVAVIAVSLYTVFDKTLLGLMTTKDNVAFYEYSNKIINIPKAIIGVVGTVTFPRACKMLNEGNLAGHRQCMEESLVLICMIGFASIFGLCAVADPLAVLYYGESFAVCGSVIKSLTPVIIIVELSSILRMQYLIPKKMDKSYTICICLNAAVNLVLSMTLIRFIGIYGAVIGTVAAELFGLIYQMHLCRDVISWRDLFREAVPFCLIGLVMFGIVRITYLMVGHSIKSLVLVILLGGLVYMAGTLLFLALFRKTYYRSLKGKLVGIKKNLFK